MSTARFVEFLRKYMVLIFAVCLAAAIAWKFAGQQSATDEVAARVVHMAAVKAKQDAIAQNSEATLAKQNEVLQQSEYTVLLASAILCRVEKIERELKRVKYIDYDSVRLQAQRKTYQIIPRWRDK